MRYNKRKTNIQEAQPMSTKHFITAARLDVKYDRTDWMTGKRRPAPSSEYLDRMADLKLTGGFKVSKANCCKGCFQMRSANGSCACTD
jgi:hypothetical protein